MSPYLTSVTVHILAAVVWLGGMLFFALVAPILRRTEPPELRASLFKSLGERLRTVGWVCISVLLVTGVLNLYLHGVLNTSALNDPEFWATRYGTTLAIKLGLVVAMIGLAAYHDFGVGPAASNAVGTADAVSLRRRASWIARTNALLGIVLIAVAVRFVRGGG